MEEFEDIEKVEKEKEDAGEDKKNVSETLEPVKRNRIVPKHTVPCDIKKKICGAYTWGIDAVACVPMQAWVDLQEVTVKFSGIWELVDIV